MQNPYGNANTMEKQQIDTDWKLDKKNKVQN